MARRASLYIFLTALDEIKSRVSDGFLHKYKRSHKFYSGRQQKNGFKIRSEFLFIVSNGRIKTIKNTLVCLTD